MTCQFRPFCRLLAAALLSVFIVVPVLAAGATPLEQISLQQAQGFFPAADRLSAVTGEIPLRRVFMGEQLLGVMYLTDDVVPMPAYSGRPVRSLVGLATDATIQGVKILYHEEPILVVGITNADLGRYISQYLGLRVDQRVRIGAHGRPGYTGVDGITGATITAMVINSTIMKSAKQVARAEGLPLLAPAVAVAAESQPETVALIVPATASAQLATGLEPVTPLEVAVVAPPVADASPTQSAVFAEEEPIWVDVWRQSQVEVALVTLALTLLMLILFFQDWLVRHARWFYRVRIGYLLFTLLYLGVYSKAQLSVINLLAFMRVFIGGFTWDTLLIDPIIFLLWGFVAVSIIFWGRGVFCGWLCPYGALQELLYKLAEKMKFPSFEFPPTVHERLWAVKYFILIALVGLSLDSMTHAAKLAEVEPFKTTFVMRFDRESLFVIYAVLLLVISMFNSKFYCKYLCPLGAGLSFFTSFRIFDWLRRRRDCGKPCQSCAVQCQISAIKPTGEIIDNECHYCLECQVAYWDDQRCPPLVEKRKKKEKREARRLGKVIASDAVG